MKRRDRAQALVVRETQILLVKHKMQGREFYCLPGGGIEQGELPEQAAIRELKEECLVDGIVERLLSVQYKPDEKGEVYTYLVNIDDGAIPGIGVDPELSDDEQTIIDSKWLTLQEIGEVDKAYLWASGLNRIEQFHKILLNTDNRIN